MAAGFVTSATAQTGKVGIQPPKDIPPISVLIKTTLVALNHANQTGNYSVLLELASPRFRAANNSAKISAAFSNLRARNLDFAPILLFKPVLTKEPGIDERGNLRFVGFFPTKPLRVNFDMAFEKTTGQWRLSALSVGATKTAKTAAADPGKTPLVKQADRLQKKK